MGVLMHPKCPDIKWKYKILLFHLNFNFSILGHHIMHYNLN